MDVIAALGFTALADVVFVVLTNVGPFIRALFGLPLLFVLPGYALVSALFPRRNRQFQFANHQVPFDVPSISERLAFGFGASITLIPLFTLLLWYTVGISDASLTLALSAFVAVGLLTASVRRHRLSAGERFRVFPSRWLKQQLGGTDTIDATLSVAVVVVAVVALSSLGYALVSPIDGDQYTNVVLLTENESGDYVTGGYPTTVPVNQSQPLVLGIQNREQQMVNYTVVVQLQRVRSNGTSLTVLERSELRRLSVTAPANQTRYVEHRVRPDIVGDNLRLTYLVYRQDAPKSVSAATAGRPTYVWLNVTQ